MHRILQVLPTRPQLTLLAPVDQMLPGRREYGEAPEQYDVGKIAVRDDVGCCPYGQRNQQGMPRPSNDARPCGVEGLVVGAAEAPRRDRRQSSSGALSSKVTSQMGYVGINS